MPDAGFHSLKTRLVMILGAILLFAFVTTSALNFVVAKRSLREHAMTETLPLISDTVYSEIQSSILQPIHNSSLMANDAFLKDWVLNGEQDLDVLVRYLATIRDQYQYFTSFFVSEKTKKYYYYDGVLKTIHPDDDHDVWYYDFIESGRASDLDVDTDEASQGTLTVFINHRIEAYDGSLLGVTGVGLKMKQVSETLRSFQDRYGRLIYMVDSTGVVQAHPNLALIESANINDLHGSEDSGAALLSPEEETHAYEWKRDGKQVFVSTRYFPSFDWFLIVEQEEARGLAAAHATLLTSLLVGISATLFVLAIILWVVNRYQRRLEILATTDGLTGLYNRRHFLDLAGREIALARRYRHHTALLYIDVDHFKSINDQHGHEAGDAALRGLALALRETLREVDLLARYGGEEFLILLPRNDTAEAVQAAERIRKVVAARALTPQYPSVTCAISIGAAALPPDEVDIALLMKQADAAMYEAKRQGRNRVCAFQKSDASS